MLFDTPTFFAFLAAVTLCYWCLAFRNQNKFLLVASYFFYGWWDWRFQCLMIDRTTASTYFFAHWSKWQADKGFVRQGVMILAVPNFRDLAARIADQGPHVNDPVIIVDRARQRLPDLAELSH